MEDDHATIANFDTDATARRSGYADQPARSTTVRIDPDGARVRLGTLTES